MHSTLDALAVAQEIPMDPSIMWELNGQSGRHGWCPVSWLPGFALCNGCNCWLAGPGHKVADCRGALGLTLAHWAGAGTRRLQGCCPLVGNAVSGVSAGLPTGQNGSWSLVAGLRVQAGVRLLVGWKTAPDRADYVIRGVPKFVLAC